MFLLFSSLPPPVLIPHFGSERAYIYTRDYHRHNSAVIPKSTPIVLDSSTGGEHQLAYIDTRSMHIRTHTFWRCTWDFYV